MIMSAPQNLSSSEVTAFTDPRVPIGKNAGVLTGPCAVLMTPSRARDFSSFLIMSKNAIVLIFYLFYAIITNMQVSLEKIVNLCKRRGFIFPGSEIYGGLANS